MDDESENIILAPTSKSNDTTGTEYGGRGMQRNINQRDTLTQSSQGYFISYIFEYTGDIVTPNKVFYYSEFELTPDLAY